MEKKAQSIHDFMRKWHGNIGYFIVGLVIIYSLSGIVLIYRDTSFLKQSILTEVTVQPGLGEAELGSALRIRNLKIDKVEGDIAYFKNGSYNTVTGDASYTKEELPGWINKVTGLHKTPSERPAHYFTNIFGVLLFFMAVSSFWMYKTRTKLFRRGIYIAGAGIVAAILLLML